MGENWDEKRIVSASAGSEGYPPHEGCDPQIGQCMNEVCGFESVELDPPRPSMPERSSRGHDARFVSNKPVRAESCFGRSQTGLWQRHELALVRSKGAPEIWSSKRRHYEKNNSHSRLLAGCATGICPDGFDA